MEQQQLSKEQALKNIRMIWAALLSGMLIFFFIVLFLNQANDPRPFEQVKSLYVIAVGFAMLSVMFGSFIRMQIYKKHWQNNCVTPRGYVSGQLLSLACIEGACLFALVVVFIQQDTGVTLALPAVLMAIFILNFPNGKPMEPAIPDFSNNLQDR